MFKNFVKHIIKKRQALIDRKNRERLTNKDITLVCSNCTGGILYHWLGLQFNSPFINLYMDNEDFLIALENFDEFISGPVVEVKDSGKDYPVGKGVHGEIIHFMHYPDFNTALRKWDERKVRIKKDNMAVMLTNFGAGISEQAMHCYKSGKESPEVSDIVRRFERLPFKNKIILSGFDLKTPVSVQLKGMPTENRGKIINIFNTQNVFGKRYIDQFDYITFINNCHS